MAAPGSSPESLIAPDPVADEHADDVVLRVDDVTVTIGDTPLLEGVSWQVELDERWVVLGPNGAGKTTLLRLAVGDIEPTKGSVTVLGEPIAGADPEELRSRVGFASASLGQRVAPGESVHDLVTSAGYGLLGRGSGDAATRFEAPDTRRAAALLRALGVGDLLDRKVGTLSEGERQRTLIARALMPDPELLMLDEPAAGLDLGAREDLVSRLTSLAADPDAPASVLVTHHVEEIPVGYSHGLLLRDGRIVAAGLLEDVLTDEILSATFGVPLGVARRRGRYTAWMR